MTSPSRTLSDTRFAPASRPGLEVVVATRKEPTQVFPAELLDCTRVDMQLRVAAPLEEDPNIVVRLQDESSGFQLSAAGAISWQQDEESGSWRLGFQFTQELDWETLGELCLCGILERPEA